MSLTADRSARSSALTGDMSFHSLCEIADSGPLSLALTRRHGARSFQTTTTTRTQNTTPANDHPKET